ncbi:MAG: universal stress protein [Myxococcales bacterium]|nr:universal stress protein [Myxococcales bacterium]MCB9708502.1 universal stress protein [Myxococcales bacterium]
MQTEKQVIPTKERKPRSGGRVLSPRHGIQHILVCLDGSTDSAICIQYALSLSDTFDSQVTLMHVMPHHDARFGPHTTDALGWEISRQAARARLKELEKDAAGTSGRRIDTRLEQGKPAERIVALSLELGADLVILGSNEQNGRPAWKLGSIAQQVLAASSSSVLIARSSAVPPTFLAPKRILVPLDGSLRTESVLPTAESIARVSGAQLLLIHVVAEPTPTCVLAAPEDLQVARGLATRLEAHATRYLEALRHQLGYDASLVEARVARKADKRQFLVDLAERERIDLIVLSAHGSTCNVARPSGSVTAHFLTHSKIPLLVLQDLAKSERQPQDESDARRAPRPRGTYPPGNG